jgi:hypothetical protein
VPTSVPSGAGLGQGCHRGERTVGPACRGRDAGARAALAGAHRQRKSGTAGMVASSGARARAPSRGHTGGGR